MALTGRGARADLRGRRLAARIVFPLAFGAFGAAFLYLSADTRLSCARRPDGGVDCRLERRVLDRLTLRQRLLRGVRGAHVDEAQYTGGSGSRSSYRVTRVVVETPQGGDALSNFRSAGDDGAAERITGFVRDAGQRELVEVQQYRDGRAGQIAGLVLLAIFALGALGVAGDVLAALSAR